MIRGVVGDADALLLAYVVMPNHLHVLVQQGQTRLGRLMQPLLTRVAMAVRLYHGIEGHVLERRFRDRPCGDPYHVRNAIVYCHLNPVRAGLAAGPGEYRWSSHFLYSAAAGTRWVGGHDPTAADVGLRLFATRSPDPVRHQRVVYDRYLAWRLARDRAGDDQDSEQDEPLPLLPGSWADTFAPLFPDLGIPSRRSAGDPRRRPELQSIARIVVAEVAPGVSLSRLRSRERTPAAVAARRRVVRRASAAGYPGVSIARYLRVSPQCVSKILKATD